MTVTLLLEDKDNWDERGLSATDPQRRPEDDGKRKTLCIMFLCCTGQKFMFNTS